MNKKLEVYAQIDEHIDAIQHYDVIQFFIRKISTTLLMGTFAATGFLLSIPKDLLPVSAIAISIFICMSSIMINLIMASMDLIFIERLLVSVFIDALRVEHGNTWLLPVHSYMMNSAKEHHGSLSRKVKFYVGCGTDLLVLLFVCLSSLLGVQHWKWLVFFVLPCSLFIIFSYGKILKLAAANSERRLYGIFRSEIGG